MGEKRQLPVFTINYRGRIELDSLIRFIRDWLVNKNFFFNEKKHKFRTDEREVFMEADRKITGYIRWYLDIQLRGLPIHPCEIETPEGKVPGWEGNFSIDFTGYFLADWQNAWKGDFAEALDFFFRKFIMRQDLEHYYEDNLLMLIDNLRRDVQNKIGMEVVH